MKVNDNYILMCSKALEIQSRRGPSRWENGDYYACTISGGRIFQAFWTNVEDEPPTCFHPIWIPRIDQYVDMTQCSVGETIQRFYEWFKEFEMKSKLMSYVVITIEECCLIFYMEGFHKKTWDFEQHEWIEYNPKR
jgi:hypothetical protein